MLLLAQAAKEPLAAHVLRTVATGRIVFVCGGVLLLLVLVVIVIAAVAAGSRRREDR